MRADRSRLGLCLGVGLGCAFAARPAAAERSLNDTVQLSLSGSLLGYSSLTSTPDPSTNTSSPPGAGSLSGLPPEQKVSTTSYGLPGSGLGFGLGVGLSDNVVLGAQLFFSGSKTTIGDSNSDGSTVQFLPRLEYVVDDTGIRPFFAAVAGVGHSSATSSSLTVLDSESSTVSTDSSSTTFLFGGSVGVHGFLSDTLSIDPAFTVLGVSGSQTSTLSLPSSSSAMGSAEQKASVSGYQVLLSIGLSGWLGGSTPHPPAHGAEVAPAVVAEAPRAQPAPAPVAEEEPLSASIGFPGQRELYLQVAADPNQPSVIAQVYVREDDSVLTGCRDVSVTENGQPLALRVTSRGGRTHRNRFRQFLAGVIPVHALTVLARPDSALNVCTEQWLLTPKARHQIRAFLAERDEISTHNSEPLEPEVAPEPPASPAPEAAPSDVSAPIPGPAGPAVPSAPATPPLAK